MERAADVSVILDGNDGQGPLLLGRFPEEPEWLVLDRHRAQEGLAVVSLTIEVPLQFPCWFHQPGTVVAWFPARDAPDPSQTSEWLALVADTIHILRQTGRAVYVHCVEGNPARGGGGGISDPSPEDGSRGGAALDRSDARSGSSTTSGSCCTSSNRVGTPDGEGEKRPQ